MTLSNFVIGVACVFTFLFVSTSALLPVSEHETKVRNDEDGILPRNVVPIHYDLEIRPNIDLDQPPFPFDGSVVINIRCVEATSEITLNFVDLSIFDDITVVNDPLSPITGVPSPVYLSHNANNANDFLTIYTVNPLEAGATYFVTINFAGILRDPTQRGIYYDYYVDRFSNTRYLVATQLESIFARAMFPCFDEPDLKATFAVTIVRSLQHISLSNMNMVETQPRDFGREADIYATSPIMSTYQVCVIVGDFQFVEADWEGVTSYPIRLYARPDMIPNLQFAATIAAPIQAWFEQETGIPYTLPKMDHIALPSKSGAMENWGLITYSEFYLCASPETSAVTGQIIVAAVISHELAHQWYGNIVTCKWWNDIWLNEGFANYYEYAGLEAIGWPASELQQSDSSQPFLDVDGRNSSDPVVKNIDNVWQAPGVFSGSTYPKGGAMVRQLYTFLPSATVSAGFTRYLNRFSYSAATTDDLWTALTEQAAEDGIKLPDGSDLDVKTLMDPWLNQMGYPILSVTNSGDGTAQVTSSRFFNPLGQTADVPSSYNYEWNVPISVMTADVEDWDSVLPTHWIRLGETSATISGIPTDVNSWTLINPKQKGFFRVVYDSDNRAAIVNQLQADHSVIPAESRSQLIDDTFTVSRLQTLPLTEAMELTKYLGSELSFNPWFAALKHLLYADRIFRSFLWYTNFQTYVMSLVEPVYLEVGYFYNYTESPLDRLLRRDIITTACLYGYPDCFDNARLMYNYYKNTPDINTVDPNNLPTVLCTGVRDGTGEDWSLVLNQYINRKATPFREERWSYLFALSCSTDTAYLDMYISYIIRGVIISTRDQTQALRYLVQSRVGLPIVWAYLDNSWNTVPSTISKFSILENIATTFYTMDDSTKFNDFVAKYPAQSDSQLDTYRRIDNIIQQNIQWVENNADQLSQWLSDNLPPLDKTPKLMESLPSSPFDFWLSMPLGFEEN